MKKILLMGDDVRARYHPLAPVRPIFELALSALGDITVQSDRSDIPGECDYDLIVSYADVWGDTASRADNAALIGYVAGGGRLLAVHGGAIARSAPDFAAVLGAMFTHHPHICPLTFQVTQEHPITRGVEPFTITEEPYRYDWDNLVRPTVLMTYRQDGQDYPAAWHQSFGLGHVVCFTPGHTPENFVRPMRQVLTNAAAWLLTCD